MNLQWISLFLFSFLFSKFSLRDGFSSSDNASSASQFILERLAIFKCARRGKSKARNPRGLDARMATLRTPTPYQRRPGRAGHEKILARMQPGNRHARTSLEPPANISLLEFQAHLQRKRK
jgi:hypothetical protein